ncbi:uncharacterized protein J3R85_015545 [Psidium guajava]|nr:uncharacterized protein J3R85_015545 [Psidium guajava]
MKTHERREELRARIKLDGSGTNTKKIIPRRRSKIHLETSLPPAPPISSSHRRPSRNPSAASTSIKPTFSIVPLC